VTTRVSQATGSRRVVGRGGARPGEDVLHDVLGLVDRPEQPVGPRAVTSPVAAGQPPVRGRTGALRPVPAAWASCPEVVSS
jgi:hypothetical protein